MMYESFKYIYKLTGGAQNQFFSRFTIMVRSMKTVSTFNDRFGYEGNNSLLC
jgi:hypothetical protein